ncbi:MAG: thioredoxin-disulfide reductase [Candidatus Amesbacteria bacterium]|nr:thioredoxin-disulfide reductase [Candidatus Amesbacteria bacterium]
MYDVIIIGSGPAGLTAGIYTARANLKTLCIAGNIWGGQLMQTTLVENYPGFPEGIQGPDLMLNMRKQAEKMGVEIIDQDVTRVDFSKLPHEVYVSDVSYESHATIIATGAEFKWLGFPNEQKLIGRGVSACATCDAAFFKDKKVVVVGGGDSAMEEALYLTKFASEVIVIHRRDVFRASHIMQERVRAHPKIKIMFNTVVTDVLGENKVEGIVTTTGNIVCDGLFVAIGHTPATKIFENQIKLDAKGYALREQEARGIFIAGDVHDHKYRQAITAAGYGCEAALDAERYLSENSQHGS